MTKETDIQSITCPNCGQTIQLTAVLQKQIEDKIRSKYIAAWKKKEEELNSALKTKDKEFEKRLDEERQKIKAQAEKKAHESVSSELEGLKSELAEKSKQLQEVKKREFELARKERELQEKKQSMKLELEQELQAERKKIIEQVKASTDFEFKDLKQQLTEKDHRLKQAEEAELQLRKRQRELEEQGRAAQLELERKIDEERKRIFEEATAKFDEDYRMKMREKDLRIESMTKQIDDLQRKAQQGSVQLQGEAQEVELDEVLKLTFRFDEFMRTPKGKEGADVLQKIHDHLGHPSGSILYESKRTTNWYDNWVEKAKEDQRDAKADVVVIVTQVLPKDVRRFGPKNGVWVTDFESVLGLALALREGLLQLSEARVALAGRSEKMEMIYEYLSGPEFKQRIQAIVETFQSMRGGLDQEKRAMEKIWAQREKEIQKVIKNTAGLYGDLNGIIGGKLPEVKALQLPEGHETEMEINNSRGLDTSGN